MRTRGSMERPVNVNLIMSPHDQNTQDYNEMQYFSSTKGTTEKYLPGKPS